MSEQYIVICLKDTTERDVATYVQVTRRRFSYQQAIEYMPAIAPSRHPRMVAVPAVKINKERYPVNEKT